MTDIRPIDTYEEARECVAFQEMIWGREFGEIVPAAILWVVARNGGVVAAAFDGSQLVGFLFGLTGLRDGAPVHWSDMLAVRPDYRGRGIGQALKHYQRDRLLEAGISRCHWTFDPLEARNAHLNFTRLGVTSAEYVRNCYGESHSPLHGGLPTDRLIVEWRVDSARVRERMETAAHRDALTAAPPLTSSPAINEAGGPPTLDLDAPLLQLLIPADLGRLPKAGAGARLEWRMRTRAAFEAYFARGYVAVEVLPAGGDYYAYMLRSDAVSAAGDVGAE